MRFVAQGAACGFPSAFLPSDSRRRLAFRLQWPSHMELVQLRRHERAPVSLPCRIEQRSGCKADARLCDMSMGGCRVETAGPLSEGVELAIDFAIDRWFPACRVEGTVRNLRRTPAGFEAGVQFTSLPSEAAIDLELFIASRIDGQRAGSEGQPRVLVLDEAQDVRSRLADHLRNAGVVVNTASCVIDAAYLLRHLHPDAVVVSSKVSELPLERICGVLRKTRGCDELPIVVHTDSRESVERISAMPDVDDAFSIESAVSNVVRRQLTRRGRTPGELGR